MTIITEQTEIAAIYDQHEKPEGAYATCRVIDHEAPGCQEWAERCTINGAPAKIYYIFEDEEAEVEDGSNIPWDAAHVSKIEIAEQDEEE